MDNGAFHLQMEDLELIMDFSIRGCIDFYFFNNEYPAWTLLVNCATKMAIYDAVSVLFMSPHLRRGSYGEQAG